MAPELDPVDRRRAQFARWSAVAKRVGYLAVLGSLVVFVIGAATSFSPAVTALIMICIVVSGITLVPAFIFGYGARAAEREEKGLPGGH